MKYLIRFNENVAQAKSLLKKLDISETNPDFLKIKEMLKGHEGYVYWFSNQHFTNKITLTELDNIWQSMSDKGIMSNFSKNVIDLKNIEEFWDEYEQAKIKQKVKQVYNEFPQKQKSFIDINNEDDYNLLSALAQDKSNSSIIRKISSYRNKKELIEAIDRLLKSKTDGSFDKLKSKIESLGRPIIYEDEDESIIITTVDYKSINILGGDTAWCIVRSEYTFNSYNSDPLSLQYIIFLLDETGNMSKIGVTVNTQGYVTAHLKNDSYIAYPELSKLLEDRGTKFSMLLPTKDNIKYNMFNDIPYQLLIDFGFSKDEIFKNKNIYKSKYTNGANDIDAISKEDIETYSILDKTELTLEALSKYNRNEILSKNLLNRVPTNQLSIGGLIALGLKDEDIKSFLIKVNNLHLGLLSIFTKDEIIKNKLLDKITSSYTLDSILALGFNIKDVYKYAKMEDFYSNDRELLEKVKNKKKTSILTLIKGPMFDFDYDVRPSIRLKLINLFDIGPSDIEASELLELIDKSLNGIIGKFVFLVKKGYKIDKNLIDKQFNTASNFTNCIVNITGVIKQIEDGASVVLKSDIVDLLVERLNDIIVNDKGDRWASSHFEIKPHILTSIKDHLKNYPELYTIIFNKSKEYYKNRIYNLVRDKDNRTSVDSAFDTISFFGYTSDEVPLSEYKSLDISTYDVDKFINKLRDKGYVIDGEKGVELIKGAVRGLNEIDLLITCIENSIDIENCYENLLEIITKKGGTIDSYQLSKIKKVIDNSDKYKDKWEEIESRNNKFEILEKTSKSSKYTWSRGGRDEMSPQKWYDTLFNSLTKININKENEGFKVAIGAIVMLAKLGKTEDFDKIQFDFTKSKGYWTNSDHALKDLCKVIVDKHVTNWKRTWNIYLNPEERKSIYEWLSPKMDKEPTDDIEKCMQVCHYLYNKDRFNKYVDKVLTSRNNFENKKWVYDKVEKKEIIKITREIFRTYDLLPSISYMGEMGKFKDIENILSRLSELKMSKKEKESTKNSLNRLNLFYSKSEDEKDEEVYTGRQSDKNKPILKEIVDRILKESIIIKWKDFRI